MNELCEAPFDSEKIKRLLRSDNEKYAIIENKSSKATSSWWKLFGFPAVLDENERYQRIVGYVSCFKCFQTFIYSSKSGTTRLKEHENRCVKNSSSSSSPSSTSIFSEPNDRSDTLSSVQSTLADHGFKKCSKISEKDIDHMKTLSAQWICKDLRPFSVIDDSGFRSIAQELIRIGKMIGFHVFRSYNTLLFF